jgi:hypothetical protein
VYPNPRNNWDALRSPAIGSAPAPWFPAAALIARVEAVVVHPSWGKQRLARCNRIANVRDTMIEVQNISPRPATLPPVTTTASNPSADGTAAASAAYPSPKLSGPLAQRQERFGVQGLGLLYQAALGSNKLLVDGSLALMQQHSIPTTDKQAGFIVSGLLFLLSLDPAAFPGLRDGEAQQLQQMSNYARARLDAFLEASKAHAASGGQHPTAPMLANVRNDALFVVNKYLGSTGPVEFNVKPAPFIPKGTTTI